MDELELANQELGNIRDEFPTSRSDKNSNHQLEESSIADPFTALMFGPPHNRQKHSQQQQGLINHLSTIDFEEMMIHIETLMDSVNGLKPLFQKSYPYIQQLWKKN